MHPENITNSYIRWFLSICRIKEICQKVIPGVKVTNPFTAAILALKTLNASPIALVTPYRNDLNLQMKSYFENEGKCDLTFGSKLP